MTSSNELRTMATPGDAGQDATVPGGQAHGGALGPTAHTGEGGDPQPVERTVLHVRVDRQDIEVSPSDLHDGKLTGRQIRELVSPPIGADRDIFEIVPGGSDKKIEDGEAVTIRDHLRFFSAPRNINPGRGNGERALSVLNRSHGPNQGRVRHAAQ